MTFAEACDMAQEIAINDRGRMQVVAIGRFKPIDQIGDGDRWGVSVVMRGERNVRVLWDPAEYQQTKPIASHTGKSIEAKGEPLLF